LLAENEIDLFRELVRRVPGLSRPDSSLNIPPVDAGLKSVELPVIASAAAAPLVATAITQIIDAVSGPRQATVSKSSHRSSSEVARTFKLSLLGLKVEATEKRKG